jgi:dihydroorotate dehydrogenase (NAD+) catalytic subunit
VSVRILNGSGCLDALTAPEVARTLDAFVTKTVTPLPREGNPPIRIAETDVGLLNSIGLQNPGVEAFVADHLPRLAALGVPLWVSVGGFAAGDYADVCAALDGHPAIETLELNVSCPNVEEAAESVAELVAASRAATALRLFVKLSPAVPDVGELVRAAEAAGADGFTLVNTIRGLALDSSLGPRLARSTGGLSGPALKPIALAAVFICRSATELPIVGLGGVATGRDALELVAAGANCVALGTVLFGDPDAPVRVRRELVEEAARLGLDEPADAFGAAHGAGSAVLVVAD